MRLQYHTIHVLTTMMKTPAFHTLLALLVTLGAVAPAQAQNPVQPDDYQKWESLGFGSLSPNGEWLAAPISRTNGENELRLHNTGTDSVIVVAYGTRTSFSKDGRWVAYAIGKSPEDREALEESDEAVRDDLGLLSLVTGEQRVISEVQRFAWGGGGSHIAMARYPDDGTSNVILEEIANQQRVSFGNVASWAWQDEGALFAFAVHGEDGVGNGVQLYDAASGRVRSLDSSGKEYAQLTWRDESSDLAVLRAFEDDEREESSHVLLAWRGLAGSANAQTLDPTTESAIGTDQRIVDYRSLTWADDGASIFFGVKEWEGAESEDDDGDHDEANEDAEGEEEEDSEDEDVDDEGLNLDPAQMEIWRSTDVLTLPTQKRDERNDERRNDIFVWHLDGNRVLGLTDDAVDNPRVMAGGVVLLATNNDAYEFEGMFGRPSSDLIVIDPASGERTVAAEGVGFPYGVSSTGKYVHFYKGGQFYAFDRDGGETLSLSEAAGISFANTASDHPVPEVPSFGVAGWTTDDESLLVYDEFDVWELPTDGAPHRLTDGSAYEVTHRVVRLDPEADAYDTDDLYVSLRGKWTLHHGIGRIESGGVDQLVYEDNNVGRFTKASEAGVFAFVAQDFDDSPDYFVGDAFDDARQVTSTNPFQDDYAWGHTELIQYTNHNETQLQGALFYPADYDPSKTYPMITYIYEFRSQSAKQYSAPTHRNYYNPSVWSAEGYFVLQPDILFDARDPGVSSAKTLERAVAAAVETGMIDADRVGLIGHSWGGYQAQFVPTYTDIFAASISGAGISNLITMYGSIFWSASIPESGHFETGQERMEVPYYVDQEAFIRNSAVFNIESLSTPMLLEVGDNDQNVHWGQSTELYNIARRAEKELTMLVYYGEGHGLREEENQADYQQRILDFFGHHLKGDEPAEWISSQASWLEQKGRNEGGR
jgi:dipeptidyl aminopeptidase/acylaminoacyl peptidase